MKLYEINQEIERIMSLATDTGELPDDAYEQIMALSVEEGEKLESVGLWVKNTQAESYAIKAEIDNLSQRRKALENRLESTKTFIGNYLEVTNRRKIETPRVIMSLRASQAVVLDDEKAIPEMYLIPQEPKISKQDIKRDLSAGLLVAGARLETRQNVQVK